MAVSPQQNQIARQPGIGSIGPVASFELRPIVQVTHLESSDMHPGSRLTQSMLDRQSRRARW
jgi:hypothetical protein